MGLALADILEEATVPPPAGCLRGSRLNTPADAQLIQLIHAATAESVRRSGAWVICGPGCTSCCLGPFDITPLDVQRLQSGLEALATIDPNRATAISRRASEYEESADAPCPVLDPETGRCDLYAARPITCRTFGPASMLEDGAIAACELNYEGATDEQIADCIVDTDPEGLELQLLATFPQPTTMTTIAEALRRP